MFQEEAKFSDAQTLFQRALAIREQTLDQNTPLTATTLNNLARVYWSQGQYSEAENLYKRALDIWERLEPEKLNLAATLDNLASLERDLGEYLQAEEHFRRALLVRQQFVEPNDTGVATILNNFGLYYNEQERYTGSGALLLRRALAIWEEVLGPEHPNVAAALCNISTAWRHQGKYSEAATALQRSLAIWVKAYGPEHPGTLLAHLIIWECFRKHYRITSEAESDFLRALAIWEKTYGPEHPVVANTLSNVAPPSEERRQISEAENLLERGNGHSPKVFWNRAPDSGSYSQ